MPVVAKKIYFRFLVNEEKVENADTVLPMSAIEKVKNRFANTLVGFFVGKTMAIHIVQNYVKNTWAQFGFKNLMKNDDGVFLFKFDSKEGLDKVLERGPWIIRNSPIILNRWTPNVSLKKNEVTKVPVWVKLHNVLGRKPKASPTLRGSNTRSGGLWSDGLDPKKRKGLPNPVTLTVAVDNELGVVGYGAVSLDQRGGANPDRHSRGTNGGRWFFKGWGIVMIPHQPSMGLVGGL
ncbi:nucleotide-binding alpha-beta plait domain-containing protein [Tanacetum coccineum]